MTLVAVERAIHGEREEEPRPMIQRNEALAACVCALFACVSGMSDLSAQTVPVVQEHYVKADPSSFIQRFGEGIAAHGDTFVVAAPEEEVNGIEVGALYVFVRDGSGWIQEARIENPLAGISSVTEQVAIWGDRLVWGAVGSSDITVHVGCALAFTRSNGVWSHDQSLVGSNTELGDGFGLRVSMSGDILAVSAPFEESASVGVNGDQDDNSLFQAGATYIFRFVGGSWVQEAYLKPSNTHNQMGFGYSLSCDSERVAVGALTEDTDWPSSGAAYVFDWDGTAWSESAFLKPSNPSPGGRFGTTIALFGDGLLVGAPRLPGPGIGIDGWPGPGFPPVEETGSVYLFTRENGLWGQRHILKASNTHVGMRFGHSLAINDEHLLVGARWENGLGQGVNADQTVSSNEFYDSGAAYLYDRRGPELIQSAYLKASNAQPSDYFGDAVALLGGTAIVGASREDGGSSGIDGDESSNALGNSGAVYVFDVNGPDPAATSRTFGANADSYTAGMPELGTTWTGQVDLATTGHAFAALVFFLEPTQVGPVWNDQWLLVGPTFPAGELFGLAPQSGPLATFDVEIPLWLPLLGLELYSQAVHFGGVQPLALSNARDLVLGSGD